MTVDFKKICDSITPMTCAVSVEKLPDGGCGKVCIVAGNEAYIASIEQPAPGTKMLKNKFVPGSEYTDYLTRDLNFEDFCFRCAVGKECLHGYVHPDRMEVWFNMIYLPLDMHDGDTYYLLYTMEINHEAKSENMANISSEVAASVLDTCIKLRGTNDFRSTIKDVVGGIRELCDADHCCILVMNEADRSCYVLAEAFGKDSKLLPMETYLDNDFYDIADSWTGTIAGSNCLIAKDAHDMDVVKERNPVWYDSLMGAGVYNIVLFPLKSRNQLLGYIWALNYDKERAPLIKETLEVTTFILGSELGNYLLLDRLRLMGSKDMLTGVMNRNEMNNVVDDLAHGSMDDKTVGVIFADLNGLKTVNDVDGHNAGDLLLKHASRVLRSVFDESEIFRAGGDEFAVIVTGITEEELEERIKKIREASAKYDNLSFALGGCVESNGSNVRLALRRADEKMYEDKRRFYEQFPDEAVNDRRRRVDASAEAKKAVDDRQNDILREMNYDHLTGLPSMTYFFKIAETGRNRMHEEKIPSVLVFINLSGLRFYNKKYGFAEGDILIKEFAKIISKHFDSERCSRFGGDHFALYTEEEGVEKKLESVFREAKRINEGRTLRVRAGIYPDSMGIVETSLACDRAKYACDCVKDDNRSYYTYYDKKMLAREVNRQYIVDNIDKAINEGWITAFYQPIVRVAGRRVCDEEALARWIDPVKGMLSPADFIPILEDTRLIYRVDLHIVDVILERIKNQMARGLTVVPLSVNLSRTDFDCCDIVSEITNRVDAAGVPRELLTIEITESVIGENFDFIKEQITRFQELGFQVWMDDFGSGYSSLNILQDMQFDLIKFDMRFMRQFETSPKSRVILTELMRMAISLGIETVTEGVETAEQVAFLSEIGCTKMQGYYFCKPIPLEKIYERNEKGEQIGFEDPDETAYHIATGSINLYDLGSVSNEESESIKHYFNTIPMAVIESDGKSFEIIRSNRSYREFVEGYKKSRREEAVSKAMMDAINGCKEVGQKLFVNETTASGDTVNAMIRRVADNPVTGKSAFAVAILAITPKSGRTLTYTGVAKALSADYIDLYHVNLKTGDFTQYSPKEDSADISAERSGKHFFETSRKDALKYIHKDDRDAFVAAFTKENVESSIKEHGVFILTYRVLIYGDDPMYVTMKAVRMDEDPDQIIIGVNNVDAQMKQQEKLERLEAETVTYSRIAALMGDFIAIYTVDPETGNYMIYSASKEYEGMQTSKAGLDFFEDTRKESSDRIADEDYDRVMAELSRENILEQTKDGKLFKTRYHLDLGNGYVHVTLRAGLVNEKDGPQLIVGVGYATE